MCDMKYNIYGVTSYVQTPVHQSLTTAITWHLMNFCLHGMEF